ncbi:succinyldiaminopimelate desuccinylase [Kushneria avicenniae]|uniref:Succinyl-diaminopimelate desuccinylase n=1 Tax=Kushneria avicenniae TaxID=402385 RepID=A0A1I1I4L1_9GAMM|nr:succinyl-diaminopimelate desuccinylase [Kushneria avicenniae]SFC28140.1 succinyldiaminopimelate desuccinylase [Kushneria avicenniae]
MHKVSDTTVADRQAPGETLSLALDLISRPSVTPEDAGCQTLIGERLTQLGFHLEWMDQGEVRNLWAVRGQGGPTLVLAGHTDVVPTGPEHLWQVPPFSPCIDDDGYLCGRGAADMKGSLAAMVTAVERFVTAHPDHSGRIAFLLTSDEEGPARDGTRAVVEILRARNEAIDYCIVGEPSSESHFGDVIKNGRRGSLNGVLRIHGVQGHVAYPQLARNPIHQALAALDALVMEHWDSGNEFFPPTSFQISNIHGGTGANNVIPGELEVTFNLRFSTEVTAPALKARIEALLDAHQLDWHIDWQLSGDPFMTVPGGLTDAVSAALRDITGHPPRLSTGGGTSDARFIATLGPQTIEFGPRNATIHQRDERILATDLDRMSQALESTFDRLLR